MTSLQRLLTAALAVPLLLPAAAQASSSMETGIADDAALLNEPSDAKAAAAVSAWAALGIDDVRIFVQWQAIAPANSEVKAPDGFNSADPNSPGYRLVARGPCRGPRQRRGHAPAARGDRTRSAVGLAGPSPPQRPLQAAPRPLRAVRARRRAALRPGRRPLDHLERAQPAAVAPAAEHVFRTALHAVRAAPLPPPGARRLPGDQGRRPDRDGAVRRPRAAWREPDEAERPHDAAGLHPLDGVRQGRRSSATAAGRARASSRSRPTASPTTRMRTTRAPDEPQPRPRRGGDRRPAAPGAHARRARSAPAG